MDVYDDVVARISTIGYCVSTADRGAITYSINCTAENIKANINCTEIPEGLHYVWVDMAVGLFISEKKATGTLGAAFDFSASAKSITEGDVKVEFFGASDGSNTPEAQFDKLLNRFINPPQSVFSPYRRIKW